MDLQKSYSTISNLDAEVLAISSDEIDISKDFAQEVKTQFPILSDPKADVIRAYGVFNNILEIAKPATFIIDSWGIIRWKYVGKGIETVKSSTIIQQLKSIP